MSQIVSDFKNYRLHAGEGHPDGLKGRTFDSAMSNKHQPFAGVASSPGSPNNFLVLRALDQKQDGKK